MNDGRDSLLYKTTPVEIQKELTTLSKTSTENRDFRKSAQFIQDFVTTRVSTDSRSAVLDDLKKNFPLVKNKEKKAARPARRKRTQLTAREKRQLRLNKLPREGLKFAAFQELHRLWTEYMENFLELGEFGSSKSQDHIYAKLSKADYHGCFIVVSKSKCPSYIGLKGIVVLETRNALQIISHDDIVRTIPKKGSVFSFTLRGILFTIFGNNFNLRPSERASRKLKSRVTIQL